MEKKSLFVVIEGLDGSGKSTVAGHLGKALAKEDLEVRMTFEPNDDSCGGEWIRDVLKKKIAPFSPKTLALAFAANRLDHCDRKIDPWLNENDNRILISDRYYLSSLVYQQTENITIEDIMSLNSNARQPDITFFLNVSNEVCLQRIELRNQPLELFETNMAETRKTYNKAIRFLKKTRKEHIIEVDANGTIEEIVSTMLGHINNHLAKH